jgi:DNA-binding CsgD family transcriptional regulator
MRPFAFTGGTVRPAREEPPRAAVRPLGRDRVLTAVRTALAGTGDRHGTALALHGESGSGKSTLLRWAAGTAADAGGQVVRVAPRPGGAAYSALRSLTAPLLAVPGARSADVRAALPDALRRHVAGGDETAVCSALWRTLAAMAERRPVLVCVDDWQLLDPASRGALAFLARRLEGTRVLLLAASDEQGAVSPAEDGMTGLPLPDLGEEAARGLLSERHPRLSAEVLTAVLTVAEGNPRALVDLPTALTPEQRAGRAPLPDPLLPGAALERRLGRRFRALPDSTRVLLAALAFLEDDAEPGDVAWLAGALGHDLDAFAPAEEAGLVSSDRTPRFVRRVHRCLAHATAPAAVRRRAGRAWAELALTRLGGGPSGTGPAGPRPDGPTGLDEPPPDAGETGPHHEDAARLEVLGHAAVAGRRWSTAVRAFRQAGDLSPTPWERSRLHTAAASAALCGGRPRLALALARGPGAGPATTTAHAVRAVRAGALFDVAFHAEESFRGLSAALDAGPVAGADARDSAAFQLSALTSLTHDPAPAKAALEALPADAADALRIAVTARLDPVSRAEEIRGRLATAAERSLRTPGAGPRELTWLADAAWQVDDLASSGRLLAAALHRSGTERGHLPHCWELRAELLTAAGRWEELRDLVARRLTEGGAEAPERHVVALKSQLLLVCAYQGRREEARELAREVRQWARDRGSAHHSGLARYAALLLAQTGDAEPAGGADWPADADPCLDAVTRQAHAVLVRGALLRDDPAAARARQTRAQRAGLTRFSDGTTLLVRHGRALLAAYTDEAGTDELFGLAEDAATASARPFDRALLALDHGRWLRRRRHPAAARARLRAAYETFGRLGATPWQDRARTELRALGALPPGTARTTTAGPALSAHERRVVRLAASGLSNREIAERLLVSPRTVASHLYKVFPRLGISSRRELQDTLLGGGEVL